MGLEGRNGTVVESQANECSIAIENIQFFASEIKFAGLDRLDLTELNSASVGLLSWVELAEVCGCK